MSLIGREQGTAQSIFGHPGRRHELAIQTPSRGQRCPWAAHGSDRTRPVWVASSFTSDTGKSPYDSPPHATTACPAASPLNPLPRPTPNRNPWAPSARSTGIAAIRGTLWPTYRPDEQFRPAWVKARL